MKTYKIRNKADGGILEVTEDQLAAYGLEVPNQMAKGGMIKEQMVLIQGVVFGITFVPTKVLVKSLLKQCLHKKKD
jgi:hypothetical protein